ncbi:uncharacterized protein MELLADRAFT_94193 [Melampsora larici-populina 98AG31]|uniref:C3H1-type domain-containing protein n=1 Tax=Melampsora larici-populina (strain 98AG31 / pathotype 3-4-7) TaxID=747676 RepID=F4S6T9_MELLP|nr:uncharacterized protein MELLADRAFT_94193 [Melampsora larici-populina 98AG31]EGF99631.1 hypothetical protein MELLADRAFT_94193 [Melampsora larici-populina 98AG31]
MTSGASAVELTNATTAIFDDINKILTNYDNTGGSKVTSMAQLRTQVASIYHYKDPDFLFHFSAIACAAISLDVREHWPCYPITTVWPDNADPQAMPPIVLSNRFSLPPTIDVYGTIKGYLERPIPPSPPWFKDLSMFPTNLPANLNGPPPPPPRPAPSQLPCGAHSNEDRTPETMVPGPSGPSLLCRIHFSKSPQILPSVPSLPIFERIDKGKRRRIPSSPSSSHTSSCRPWPAPAASGAPAFPEAPSFSGIPALAGPIVLDKVISAPYMDDNEHLVPEEFSPGSYHVNQIALLYKSDIKHHIAAFNSCKNRPANWQNSLTKDLLDRLCINADGDLKNFESSSPKEITDNNHWQNLLAVLEHAYIAAFPPAAISIKGYFDYILSLPGLFQACVHWEDVRDCDAELRKEFASRPSLVWGDYEHKSLKGIDNRILYSRTSKLGCAAIPAPKYQSPQPSLCPAWLAIEAPPKASQSSSHSAASKKARGRQVKPLYKVKPSNKVRDLSSLPVADQPCNNWNARVCPYGDNDCDRVHGVCNKDGCFESHQGTAVNSSINADPLPAAPPLSSDPLAAYAIKRRPDIFKINCSIYLKNLKFLLKNHPNKPFVNSIILGLTDGFWPISSKPSEETVFNPNHASGPKAEEVLFKTRDKELKLNRFSPPFFTLLPGMKVSPLCLATNPSSGKVRMCTNMSFGCPSLNDLIKKEDMKIDLDGIPYFIPFLLYHYFGKNKFILWKSDVDAAFRNLPVLRQWQFRQIVKIGNSFHADQNVNFGCSSLPKLWCAFFSLILWIAYYEFNITNLNAYMDNSWGIGLELDMVSFKGKTIHLNQAQFLPIFDFINLPWAWEKQVFGSTLDIIGYSVDCLELSISLPEGK